MKIREILKNKWFLRVANGLLFLAYACLIAGSFASYNSIDSDYANLVLEANDILHGNVFLSGWNLTGISFIPTDSVFFLIGAAVGGVSIKSYVIAVTLMFLSLIVCGYLLIRDRIQQCPLAFVVYATIACFPTAFLMSVVRAHTGGIVWGLLAVYLLRRQSDVTQSEPGRHAVRKDIIKSIAALLLFAMAAMGDAVSILIVILPLFLLSLLSLLRDYLHFRSIQKADMRQILVAVLGTGIGFLGDKLYFLIGGARKNSFLSAKTFITYDSFGTYFSVYLKSLLAMFDADFENQQVISIHTFIMLLNLCVILLALGLYVREIVRFLKDADYDFISLLMGTGFFVISVCYLVTGIMPEAATSRYYATSPVLLSVILARSGSGIWVRLSNERVRRLIGWITLLAALAMLAGRLKSMPLPTGRIECDADELQLMETLKEHGLTEGYGEFWTASLTTVYSHDQIHVRAISSEGDQVTAFDWFNCEKWYTSPANFVVVNADGSGMYFNIINAYILFGDPDEVVECGKYRIYIYDHDLREDLNMEIASSINRTLS